MKRLENYISYRKRLETKFSGWMENRLLLANVGKTLFIDGGWLMFCLLIGCCSMAALQSWKQPKCCPKLLHRLPVLCSIAIPFLVFICGFFMAFVAGSVLAEVYVYDSGSKELSPQHSPVLQHFFLDTNINMCFLKDQHLYERSEL